MIKAITTKYNGYRFRSRLEARWAIFFDIANIGWEYEPEGFRIGRDNYLIDFRIQSFGESKIDLYIEIKPNKPTKDEIEKCFKLAIESEISVALICGTPGLPEFSKIGEDWNLKKGHVIVYFPSKQIKANSEIKTNFETWYQTNRFSLFQTDSEGNGFDIWPIYFLIEQKRNDIFRYDMVSRIHESIQDGIYGLNPGGKFIKSVYFSGSNSGRFSDHEKIMYSYEIAKSARFEFDEFNLNIPQAFYREIENIPLNIPYTDRNNLWTLYYNRKKKNFKVIKFGEQITGDFEEIEKRAPKELIRLFTKIYVKRTTKIREVREIWKGYLFRYNFKRKNGYIIKELNNK